MDTERLTNLTSAYTEAQMRQMIEADKLSVTKAAHDEQQAAFKRAQDHENAAKQLLDDFIRDQTKADARERKIDWALD